MSNFETRIHKLLNETKEQRNKVRCMISKGEWKTAEPDPTRMQRFVQRTLSYQKIRGAESQQGPTLDWQPAAFLTEGTVVRRSIAFVEVIKGTERNFGSGFMISPSLFITNSHVIDSLDAAKGTTICFDKERNELGGDMEITVFALNPEAFFLKSDQNDLDYAIVAVGSRLSGKLSLDAFGYIPLSNSKDRHIIGMNVNIIQHPRMMPKMITIRENYLTHRTEHTLLYDTDTDVCSSGSPVFNDDWDLVALHHWGGPYLALHENATENIPDFVNEGIRISAIYQDLEQKASGLPAAQKELLLETLEFCKKNPITSSLPNITKKPAQFLSHNSQTKEAMQIPAEVKIMIDGNEVTYIRSEHASESFTLQNPKNLTKGPESVKIDLDYSNREGYNKDFIPGKTINLPDLKLVANEIAPLDHDQPNAKRGELKYTHFTVVLNRNKKMAFYTATNIDGNTYKVIDRNTGKLSKNNEEGDKWYDDSRSDVKFYLGQEFYSAWSHLFDRGHLTRRSDPTWGEVLEAERANADTFHFTNCSPQHWRFNQAAKFWQGVERYILENGAIAEGSENKISVFQGPIFNDADDTWAGDVQIASKFFKVAVWLGPEKLKSVGLIVDQTNLMEEQRKFTGKPKDLPFVDVNHWRVPIEEIERLTKIIFDKDIVKADTIEQRIQPRPGAESFQAIKVNSFSDIKL